MKNNDDKKIMLLKDCNNSEIGSKAKNIKIIQESSECKIPKTLVITANVFRDRFARTVLAKHTFISLSKRWLTPLFM